MTINDTWTDPAEAGALDLDTGETLTETVWDAVMSNLNFIGGSDGASGAINHFAVLAETVLGSAAATIDFTSIPATYRHLKLVCYAQNDTGASTLSLRFNGDSGASYDFQNIRGSATNATAGETFAATEIGLTAIHATANIFTATEVMIPHYANTANNKSLTATSAYKQGVASTNLRAQTVSGFWRNNSAINRITLINSSNNFNTGTVITLYGLETN